MHSQAVAIEMIDRVLSITLNREQSLNALTSSMLESLLEALQTAQSRGARAILITGSGRAFCSGIDLVQNSRLSNSNSSFDAGQILEQYFNPMIQLMQALPVPIVCAINGPAVGAGCAIALAGDIAIASNKAYFLLPFVNIGFVPDAGSSWILPRSIGSVRARAMMLLGERVSADQAESWGMIYRSVDERELPEAARRLAVRLAQGPTLAIGMARQGLLTAMEGSLTEALSAERNHQRQAGSTQDFQEGVRAFRERRMPVFKGE